MLVFGVPRFFFLSTIAGKVTSEEKIRPNLVLQRRRKVNFNDFFLKKSSVNFFHFFRIDAKHSDLTPRFFQGRRNMKKISMYTLKKSVKLGWGLDVLNFGKKK